MRSAILVALLLVCSLAFGDEVTEKDKVHACNGYVVSLALQTAQLKLQGYDEEDIIQLEIWFAQDSELGVPDGEVENFARAWLRNDGSVPGINYLEEARRALRDECVKALNQKFAVQPPAEEEHLRL